MTLLPTLIIALVAIIHLGLLLFEMFAWEKLGPKVFKHFPGDFFETTKAMAANQGLYNGFLAAGLAWSLLIGDPAWQQNVALCFLLFVSIAGAYGAATVARNILFIQSVPALAGIVAILL